MSKPRHHSAGFSNITKYQPSKNQPSNSSADHAVKEALAASLLNERKLQKAEAIYKVLISADTNNHIAYGNLAAICGIQGRFDELIELLKQALQLKPNCPEAHYNLGNILQEKGDQEAAIASYNKALQLKPNYPEAYNNLGVALQEQSKLGAAIASYNKALQLNPNYPEAHYNSALIKLLSGDYKTGWESYEWRLKNAKGSKRLYACPKCNQWNGEVALIETNQLLPVVEQGLRDTLKFMRYANALKNEGISVSFCAQKKLHSLIQASGIDHSPLTPSQANEVHEGQWMPLLSTAKHLQVSPNNPRITEPYIQSKDELKAKWAGILGQKKNQWSASTGGAIEKTPTSKTETYQPKSSER